MKPGFSGSVTLESADGEEIIIQGSDLAFEDGGESSNDILFIEHETDVSVVAGPDDEGYLNIGDFRQDGEVLRVVHSDLEANDALMGYTPEDL
ncbi:hypothetical protein [Salinicola rhizosphaerae]|uniref:Uncharacterized protein n=1 Tax=Salinicola rhizosphaerae TaxID=1443141 RepID=A0ABQ3E3D0_9GAMM|nr:hypothetical protein [Salinicola rhizosphaerae]GHB24510.1 hypothetical protein GCM10009038_24490 [Salinicola rhizosphaerae]